MVVHLFNGDLFFHTKPIIRNIVKHSKIEHHFVLVLKDKSLLESYESYLGSLGVSYTICYDSRTRSIFKLLLYFWGYRGSRLSDEARILSTLWKHRNQTIILHWYSKSYLLLPAFKNVSWVCWGNIARPKEASSSIGELLHQIYIKQSYKKYNKIICLLDADKTELINSYKCKENQVEVISYIPYYLGESPDQSVPPKLPSVKPKVLLGNNAWSSGIKFYNEAVDLIKGYANQIELYVILNYGVSTVEEKTAFINKSRNIFGNSFYPVEEFIPQEKFYNWLDEFDVYISNHPTQSGLSIIYNMVKMGKKLFLTGYNLDWCRKNGFVVYDIRELEHSKLENLAPLQSIDKLNNQLKLNILLNVNALAERWEDIYCQVLTAPNITKSV